MGIIIKSDRGKYEMTSVDMIDRYGPQAEKFIQEMLRRMADNEDRTNWLNVNVSDLLNSLKAAVERLENRIRKDPMEQDKGEVKKQDADVANFAFFIFDWFDKRVSEDDLTDWLQGENVSNIKIKWEEPE